MCGNLANSVVCNSLLGDSFYRVFHLASVFFSWGLLVLGYFGQFVCIWYFSVLIFLLYVVICVRGLYLLLVYCVFCLFMFFIFFSFMFFPFSFLFSFSFWGKFFSHVVFWFRILLDFSSSFLQFFLLVLVGMVVFLWGRGPEFL